MIGLIQHLLGVQVFFGGLYDILGDRLPYMMILRVIGLLLLRRIARTALQAISQLRIVLAVLIGHVYLHGHGLAVVVLLRTVYWIIVIEDGVVLAVLPVVVGLFGRVARSAINIKS